MLLDRNLTSQQRGFYKEEVSTQTTETGIGIGKVESAAN